ncbi:transmembrane protein 243b isoform X2 [Heptranchias perlo]|uniref:transmembrane protein 243b isoform X2 n=1 Tax=Heptranchias perlo TaxID=212740 RepID=UPI00355A2315
MDEYATRTYGTSVQDNRPLFGETSARVTIISAFVFPHLPPKPLNVFFVVCILLSCASIGVLIYWYRQGDLEPKFRNLIYYNLFSILMLCICANLYFHDVDK